MNIHRLLEEMAAADFAPPSRLDAEAAFTRGARRRRVRRFLAIVAAATALGLGTAGVAQAITGRPLLPFSPKPKASPSASPLPASPSPVVRALDCKAAASQVRAVLRDNGFGPSAGITCGPDRLTATVELVTSPIRVVLTIRVTMHSAAEAAALSCSGKPGVCQQAGSAKIARADGLLITVEASAAGADLRSLALDLNANL